MTDVFLTLLQPADPLAELLPEAAIDAGLALIGDPTIDPSLLFAPALPLLGIPTGPPGPKGDPGEVGDLSLAVEMLPSTSPPSVAKTGTPDAPVFTLGIPRSDIQTFMQTLDTSATEWTVSHMLGRFPNVQVMDSAGSIIFVNVTHIDANTTAISYNAAFVGKATFS